MYVFLILAVWRVLLDLSNCIQRTRVIFLFAAMLAAGALLYQGKTGGETRLRLWCRHGTHD
jgi:hypothetical protein